MATITIIQPDGTKTVTEREPTDHPKLEELQKAVDGYLVAVNTHLPKGTKAYVNEDGLLVGLSPNPEGTKAVKWTHLLVGPVVICEGFAPEKG